MSPGKGFRFDVDKDGLGGGVTTLGAIGQGIGVNLLARKVTVEPLHFAGLNFRRPWADNSLRYTIFCPIVHWNL